MTYFLSNIKSTSIIRKIIQGIMMKDYDKWNEIKKETSKKEQSFTFKIREIYWLKVGVNIGYEVYGKVKIF